MHIAHPPSKIHETMLQHAMDSLSTRNAGSQSNEGDRVDAVLEVDEAAEMAGNVADHGGAGADHEDGNDKGGVSIVNGWEEKAGDHCESEDKCKGAAFLSKCIPGVAVSLGVGWLCCHTGKCHTTQHNSFCETLHAVEKLFPVIGLMLCQSVGHASS